MAFEEVAGLRLREEEEAVGCLSGSVEGAMYVAEAVWEIAGRPPETATVVPRMFTCFG